ncbi:AAA family ATPase [Natronoglycomyces albus]|uniref:AAA family ATPase n=1 Tax=Natronoglycomyces albus TaxID=2811108 RepID=A0A895XLC5_9ACTN|nr:AAA family ATPase [Natronoglycomyces albus]
MDTISLENCSFSYRRLFRSVPVFAHFDVTFEPGTTVLLGPNGAGKTTLMSLATTVLTPRGGRLSFNGEPVDSPAALRRFRTHSPTAAVDPSDRRLACARTGRLRGMAQGDEPLARVGSSRRRTGQNRSERPSRTPGNPPLRRAAAAHGHSPDHRPRRAVHLSRRADGRARPAPARTVQLPPRRALRRPPLRRLDARHHRPHLEIRPCARRRLRRDRLRGKRPGLPGPSGPWR